MRRRHVVPLAAVLALAGCGESHSSSTSTAASAAATTAASSTAAAPPSTTAASRTTASQTTSPSATSTPASGGASPAGTSTKPAAGSIHVRVPATFTLSAGGRVTPATVSAPAFLAVMVTVLAKDGKAHRVVVETPSRYRLSVPAGGRASVLVRGQRPGQYALVVDGSKRGALLIGGEPGP